MNAGEWPVIFLTARLAAHLQAREAEMEKAGRKRRGFGEGGIYWQESRQQYVAQISLGMDANGKRVRKAVMGKTKAEVQAKMATLQEQVRKGQITTGPDQTVGSG